MDTLYSQTRRVGAGQKDAERHLVELRRMGGALEEGDGREPHRMEARRPRRPQRQRRRKGTPVENQVRSGPPEVLLRLAVEVWV